MKLHRHKDGIRILRRTPRGVRGLKPKSKIVCGKIQKSHPARGAWIETRQSCTFSMICIVAPREGCVD